ncbi:MAG: di-trans,poly-cis-decaprenylcistransferase, partial [Muribaculaceae bacterium]|nr:di-trans,poly-cis-decaprenylcistransferase [Muribaculaceae bacterium]
MSELQDRIDKLDLSRLPRHVAMIMDGNGRWANAKGLDRSVGHYEGVKSVRRATELSSDLGIDYLTLYAFSTENWNRPQKEVDILMHLIGMAIEQETPDLVKNNVHLRLIGDIE